MRSTKRRYSGSDSNEQSDSVESSESEPVLRWVEDVDTKFRFRYESELGKGSHGSLRSATGFRRTFPKIELLNYTGKAFLCVRLLTFDYEEHVHKLVDSRRDGKPQDAFLIEMNDSSPNSKTAELQHIGILFIGKEKLDQLCREVMAKRDQSLTLNDDAFKKYRKQVENIVMLCIVALDEKHQLICKKPLYSNQIKHSKSPATSDMNIEYVSRVSGFSKGGDDVFIFTSKIQKEDIIVRFFEKDSNTGVEIWDETAKIVHVHHQVAIYFRTPAYRHIDLKEKVDVKFELYRKSNGETSRPRDFTYIPDDSVELQRKRRKTATRFNHDSQTQLIAPARYTEILGRPVAATAVNPVSSVPTEKDTHQANSTVTAPTEMTDVFSLEVEGSYNAGLKSESKDPCLAGVPSDPQFEDADPLNLDYFVTLSEERLEEEHNPIFFDKGNRTAQMEEFVLPKEECVRNVSVDKDTAEGEFLDDSQRDGAMAVQPEGGTGMAYRLALSTAHALHEFSRTGDVRFLLASMRHLIAVQDECGDNAIHSSVIHTQEETLRNLVEVARTVADYDIVNMCNEIKQTPLHIAVYTQQEKVIEVLLFHGANPNVADSGGNTPVHMAAQHSNSACLGALLNTNTYVVKYESHMPDLNAYNFSGLTALHLAVLAGSDSNVRSLCAKGCNVDLLDRTHGRSALHLAVEKNRISIIRLLLEEAGADTDVHMFNGNTPLHLACEQNQLESISLLVQAHADPYLENLEAVQDNISDGEASSSDEESTSAGTSLESETETRGLTSLDLAHSDEARRLLRGELDPAAVQIKTEEAPVQEVVVAATAIVKRDVKSEMIPKPFDSGIGLSGTNLSLAGDSNEEEMDESRVTDLLDERSLRFLSERLDRDNKWEKVANILDMSYLIKTLKDLTSSPSLSIMSYAKVDRFQDALEKLHFIEELKVVKEAKITPIAKMTRLTDELEKQVDQLKL